MKLSQETELLQVHWN